MFTTIVVLGVVIILLGPVSADRKNDIRLFFENSIYNDVEVY